MLFALLKHPGKGEEVHLWCRGELKWLTWDFGTHLPGAPGRMPERLGAWNDLRSVAPPHKMNTAPGCPKWIGVKAPRRGVDWMGFLA